MSSFKIILLLMCLTFISSCQEIRINANYLKVSPPSESPGALTVNLTDVPASTSLSPVFSLSSEGATEYQIRIYRSSDGVVIQDWTTISSGSSLSGLALNESTSYYADFRAINSAGMSGIVRSEDWIPNSEECTGTMISSGTYAGGDGSHTHPFLICTADQLIHMATDAGNMDKTFKLLANIDLGGSAFDGVQNKFTGRFSGNNKIIRNMSILRSSGNSVGFFNETEYAMITNLTFENPSVIATASDYVAIVTGYSYKSFYKDVSVINGTVAAVNYLGLFAGVSDVDIIIDTLVSGNVTGQVRYVGGLIGEALTSTVLNAVATIDVDAPTAYEVGGLIGATNFSLTRIQNVHVTGTINGGNQVGGLIGSDGDGINLFRSSFSGSIKGNENVGGVFGAASDTPTSAHSVTSDFIIEANRNAGGLIGGIYDTMHAQNVLLRGSLSAVGINPENFGGIIGQISNYNGSLRNSMAIVDITGSARNVGGMVGEEQTNSLSIQSTDNAIIADVTGSDASNTVSLFSGFHTPGKLTGTSYYFSGGLCDNTGAGSCNTSEGTPIASEASFYTNGSLPLSNWDFTDVWRINPGTFPELRQEQKHSPTVNFSCHNQVLQQMPKICDAISTDSDLHEFRAISFGSDHTCRWFFPSYGDEMSLTDGYDTGGSKSEVGTCEISFILTDGAHSSSPVRMTMHVYDDISIAPAPAYSAIYDFGGQSVSGGAKTTTFTITNNKSFPITGFSFSSFDEGSYSRSGGTCGVSIPAGSNCTIIIAFDPATTGSHQETLDINFSHSTGPVRVEFKLTGTGF